MSLLCQKSLRVGSIKRKPCYGASGNQFTYTGQAYKDTNFADTSRSAVSIFTVARHAKYTSGNSGRHSRGLAASKCIT